MIANGQGSMKGQIFRIAHLGYFDFADLFAVIAELEIILHANGYPVEFGYAAWLPYKVSTRGGRRGADCQRMIVLVAEPLAEAAVSHLKSQPGWNIDRLQSERIREASGAKPTR